MPLTPAIGSLGSTLGGTQVLGPVPVAQSATCSIIADSSLTAVPVAQSATCSIIADSSLTAVPVAQSATCSIIADSSLTAVLPAGPCAHTNENTGNFGLSLYGLDPYGSNFANFEVVTATSYGPHFVQVRFTDILDLTDAALTDTSNYSIPGLGIFSAVVESADSVVLETSLQSFIDYTVTVTEARSYFQIPLHPPCNTATFVGFPLVPTYFSCGTTPTRVRLIFSSPMQSGPLTDIANYTVTDLNQNVFPILSVQLEQTANPHLSVVLTLGHSMVTTNWYQTLIGPAILDIDGQAPQPPDYDFQFVLPVQNVTVPIAEFSGEVSGPPFGDPLGLVYFSPSLNVAASNSIIQVEEVDVCTTAYDQYTFPQPVDPIPFFTWSAAGPQTFLEPVATPGPPPVVLFAGFPRMSEAMFSLEFTPTHLFDQMPEAFDGSCSVVLRQTFAPGQLALLNDPAFWLFDGNPGHETTPPMWICAVNAPPTPGGNTIIVLHMALVGNSTMTVAEPHVVHWALTHMVADSTFTTSPEIAPTKFVANSFMRVGRPSLHFHVSVDMVGSATLKIAGLPAPQNHAVSASIVGSSQVHAHCEMVWQATAAMAGVSTIFVRANRHVPTAAAAVIANSAVSATATVGPTAVAHLQASASVSAVAHVHHFASVSISGHSAMSVATS